MKKFTEPPTTPRYVTGHEKILEEQFGAEYMSPDEYDPESIETEDIVDDAFIASLIGEKKDK